MARWGRTSAGLLAGAWFVVAVAACGGEAEPAREVDPPTGPGPGEEPPGPPPPVIENPVRTAALEAGLAPLEKLRDQPARPIGPIKSQEAAIRLGKALFWDTAVGSDGQTACATCHFSAGSDARLTNVVHPGPNGIFETGNVTAAGATLGALVRISSDDRIGSPGAHAATFVATSATDADQCQPAASPVFGEFRQVTPRNAPTVIGASVYRDQFWDGRAESLFNGNDPFGDTENAGPSHGPLEQDASLASQSLAPPLSAEEMSCAGRAWNGAGGIAGRLLDRPVLATQQVAADDSVLGSLSAYPGTGLRCGDRPCTYRDLVAPAFGNGTAKQAEASFSRIFGLSIAAYEETLLPDQTPYDRWLAGDEAALTQRQQLGVQAFVDAACSACHAGPELTDASQTFYEANGPVGEFGNDVGYHNIGVRPTEEDLGRAALGPNGVSYSRSGSPLDRGAFKTPGLRNVALTAPYFHNGGSPTLQAVMNFYDRGGDHENEELSPRIQMLGLDPEKFQALVDLMENGLTDCRVAMRRAPFDHPSIDIPDGPSLPAVGAGGLGPCP